ncbi:MAG TPA: response regulator [Candidatus Kapabacteria bacterium]|nr:response regulator [Candidatus Kapabacteria bacterium]
MQQPYHILVVEDEPAMQILLRHNLARAGFGVTVVTNGVEAQGLLESRSFDLICSDVMMSGMDGMQLCNWVKSQPELCATPFVLLSSRAQQGDREAGLEAGADIYMTKPFDVEQLVVVLRQLLEEKK